MLQAGEMIIIAPEGTIPRGPAFFATELRVDGARPGWRRRHERR